MDQVSRPLLIALGATVAFFAVWLVALRPGVPPADTAPPAPTQAAGQVGQPATAAPRTGAAPGAPAPATARPAPAKAPASPPAPGATASRREAAALRDIRAGRVVVMLFWNVRGDDDRATRAAVASLDRRGGRVAVHVVPVSRVGEYPSITQGVTISQSPTTLVIGADRRARVIAGLSEPRELSQAVGDALARR